MSRFYTLLSIAACAALLIPFVAGMIAAVGA